MTAEKEKSYEYGTTIDNVVKEIYGYIHELANDGNSPERIYNKIREQFNYSDDYMNSFFSKKYGKSLHKYINHLNLAFAFNEWKEQGMPKITAKTKIRDIDRFKIRFENAFGFLPEDAVEQDIDLMDLLLEGEATKELVELADKELINQLKNKNGHISLCPNLLEILFCELSSNSFSFPKKLYENSPFRQFKSQKEKVISLAILSLVGEQNADGKKDKLTISIDDVQTICDTMTVDEYEGTYILHYIVHEDLKETFVNNIDTIIERSINTAKITEPDKILRDVIDSFEFALIDAKKKSKIATKITVEDVAKHSTYSEAEFIDNMWELFKIGVLRIPCN